MPRLCRYSARPVVVIRQPSLAGILALGRVGDGVVMVRVIGPMPACLKGFLRWLCRLQAVATVADQILTTHSEHGLPGVSFYDPVRGLRDERPFCLRSDRPRGFGPTRAEYHRVRRPRSPTCDQAPY